MKYLVHKDFSGTPIGIWNEEAESFYPRENNLKKSADSLMDTRFEGEPWDDFADRLSSRISHRDWWETHDSEKESLEDAWIEIVPSDAPLF